MKKLGESQIQAMRGARRKGATLQALAAYFGVSERVIHYHTNDIVPLEKNGNRPVIWIDSEELAKWLPQLPWDGFLPVPLWYARSLGLDWRSTGKRLRKRPKQALQMSESISDIEVSIAKPRKKRRKK